MQKTCEIFPIYKKANNWIFNYHNTYIRISSQYHKCLLNVPISVKFVYTVCSVTAKLILRFSVCFLPETELFPLWTLIQIWAPLYEWKRWTLHKRYCSPKKLLQYIWSILTSGKKNAQNSMSCLPLKSKFMHFIFRLEIINIYIYIHTYTQTK
jgi:hypothetical protein